MQQNAPALMTNSSKKGKDSEVNSKAGVTIHRTFVDLNLLLYISPWLKIS